MNISKTIKDLCTPAYVYFILSTISVVFYVYHMSSNGINNNHTIQGLAFNAVYYLVWTCILNLICNSTLLKNKVGKNAGKVISWLLVLFPIIFMLFFMILYFMYADSLTSVKEEVESERGREEINEMNILYGDQAPQLSQFESGVSVN